MIDIRREGVLLEATDLEFENQAVLNPTIYQEGRTLHMFYRAVRQGNYSSIGYIKLNGPLDIIERKEEPIIFPEYDYEIHGVEDPRIVFLDGIFYLFYTAYDGKNARVAFATSKDLVNWEKHGLITPSMRYEDAKDLFKQSRLKHKYYHFVSYIKDITAPDVLLWEKDSYLFPKKYNDNFFFIHRILPDIQMISFKDFNQLKDLTYWEEYLKKLDHYVLMEPEYGYESHIGAGAPLINTSLGWLLIYHAVEDTNAGQIYHASAALLEKDPPFRVIGRLKKPLFSPKEDYEKMGDVWNVVFPTGTAIFKKRLYIYYGAADKRVAVVSCNLNALLKKLIQSRSKFDVDIGFLAGEIFRKALRKEIALEQLEEEYKDRRELLLMAIGWLAREEKVIIRWENGKVKIWTGNIK
ncbi:MAG: pesticidal protein Cry7Aa [Promethearchaeota archaeon]|nr:MAG: pesticidal protein Cry7Aa [Candidatus Lokiarchaeota archaeon]